jgi:hypothetical protein
MCLNYCPIVFFIRWFTLLCAFVLVSGCATATAELTTRSVNEVAKRNYQNLYISVDLSETADKTHLTKRFLEELDRYHLQTTVQKQAQVSMNEDQTGTALLKVIEVDRHFVTIKHRQRYGRTSLTQMRGLKKTDAPVITLRVTFVDITTGQTMFQADYVTQGPWYADSTVVVAALASTLVEQLESEGFIAVK